MSLCGGQAVIPQSIIFSIRNASEIRNIDPILFKLLTLSKIKINGAFSEILKSFPDFAAGDTINVHIKIKEGNKERIQQFQGTVLQRKNPGTNGETFTLRKISDSIAVEKIMPIFSPSIDKIELVRKGKVRRARIFYLRDRKGKSAKIKERL